GERRSASSRRPTRTSCKTASCRQSGPTAPRPVWSATPPGSCSSSRCAAPLRAGPRGERARGLDAAGWPRGRAGSAGAATNAGRAGTMSCRENVVRLQEGQGSAEVPAPGKQAWHADGRKREELSGRRSQGEVRAWCRSSEGLLREAREQELEEAAV